MILTLGSLVILSIFLAADPPEGAVENVRLIASVAAALMGLGIIALIFPRRLFVVFRMLGFSVFAGYVAYFIDTWWIQEIPIRFSGDEDERASGRALLGLLKIGGLGLVVALFARTPTRPDSEQVVDS